MAARAIGKIMAMTPANIIPGHLAAPGRLSEIHELQRVQKMVRKFILSIESVEARLSDSELTYSKGNNVDLGD